ncbi:hypothetical protein LGQ02_17505 [Bacillus shivajii]|uniref:YncE family protein n=1 Tax=Bacillus shivajii TaxID=1983719 RepID=UPI001CFBC66B|nr:hypothetical protein [Bacillus shivajii]UCZ52587.1 hypothetical protein LGQ02_17505 [Bacillus shivajii]
MSKVINSILLTLLLVSCQEGEIVLWDETDDDLLLVAHIKEPLLTMINVTNGNIHEEIPLPFTPSYMVHDEKRETVFITSEEEEALYSLDLNHKTLQKVVNIGEGFSSMILDEKKEALFLANSYRNQVVKVDISNNVVEEEITTGDHPFSMDIDYDKNELYIVNVYSNNVQVINMESMEMVKQFNVIERPNGIFLLEDGFLLGGHGPIGELNRQTFYYDDNGNEITHLETGVMPVEFLSGTKNDELYVLSHGSHTIHQIDRQTFKVNHTIDVDFNPYFGHVHHEHLFVSALDGHSVSFIDLHELHVEKTISVAPGPHALVFLEGSK